MITNIFDSHSHYDAIQFDEDRECVLDKIASAGVVNVLSLGDSLESSRQNRLLSEKVDFLYFAAGVHPENAAELPDDWLAQIAEMAKHPKCVAIGEIGLDYYWPDPPRHVQPPVLIAQLELAKDLILPVSLHDRDAHEDLFKILHTYRPQGVIHRFSGSPEMALEATKLGLYLGFGGSITYTGSKKMKQSLQAIPKDRILLETDCPYLAPQPFRGNRCDSSMLDCVCECMGSLLNMTAQEVANLTNENARALFHLD